MHLRWLWVVVLAESIPSERADQVQSTTADGATVEAANRIALVQADPYYINPVPTDRTFQRLGSSKMTLEYGYSRRLVPEKDLLYSCAGLSDWIAGRASTQLYPCICDNK